MREDRTFLLDNLRVVIDEPQSKTDTGEADTLAKFLSYLVNKVMGKAQVPALLSDFITKTIRLVIKIIGFICALSALEVSIAPLLAIVGAMGFILAFAMQESLSNFASGMIWISSVEY